MIEKKNSGDNSSIISAGKNNLIITPEGRKARLNVHAAAITGGSGSGSAVTGGLWTTGLPLSSGESSEGGTEVDAAATTTSLGRLAARLDFLVLFPDFATSSSPPVRLFFFFPRSAGGCSSSEVTIWLLAVCSVEGGGRGAWPGGAGIEPYAPGWGGYMAMVG